MMIITHGSKVLPLTLLRPQMSWLLLLLLVMGTDLSAGTDTATYRNWIKAMKQADRGPFARIRWFCADGTILPPEPYACRDHGGGRQHGEYSERTAILRSEGYLIANVLAALSPEAVLADEANQLKWILLERYLFASDDGWILRRARHYRGALQSEAEARAAQSLLRAMLAEDRYRTTHYLLLREAARLLPWHAEFGAFDKARGLTSTIAESDPDFATIRNKIHSFPEPDDIDKVRRYADTATDPEQQQQLHELIEALEQTFQRKELDPLLRQLAADQAGTETKNTWADLAEDWAAAATPEQRLAVAGRILIAVRESLHTLTARQCLTALELSLAAEHAAFADDMELLSRKHRQSREWHLQRLRDNLDRLYGTGFLTEREWNAQRDHLAALKAMPALAAYRDSLGYLARVTAWADARFSFFFQNQLQRFDRIEPQVEAFITDRLRSSPLLLHSHLLATLTTDADRIAGVHHEIFGQTVSPGLRSLNPGIARGTLRYLSDYQESDLSWRKPIVLAGETVANLPPVAGILTAHEGNVLSHVQLLARNLGIPNVVISDDLLSEVEKHTGERVVLLSSSGGVVRLHRDAPRWDAVFPEDPGKPVAISPDLNKLDLGKTAPIPLSELRAKDSGRTVGPKAAGLGELKAHFPERVSAGLVLPFGAFREQLEQPYQPGGPSLFEWMRQNYLRLAAIDDPAIRQQETSTFLAEVRQRIRDTELEPSFRQQLKSRMQAEFGDDGSYGVFVRSDTNIEDLPSFTGAGLNLTEPNITRFERIIDAIKAVWASPFTERAFGWRQALMERPEHVYVSVLLHETIPADKSGVMVTADIRNNQPDKFSIAANEGLGGGVEGQQAESLMVDVDTGEVRLLASAAEPLKWILPVSGGMQQVPASGTERVLSENDIEQLIAFGRTLSKHYPGLLDEEDQPVPADVEFAFADDHLYLIQLRPFLQSSRAQRNRLLMDLDRELKATASQTVDLTQRPGTATGNQ